MPVDHVPLLKALVFGEVLNLTCGDDMVPHVDVRKLTNHGVIFVQPATVLILILTENDEGSPHQRAAPENSLSGAGLPIQPNLGQARLGIPSHAIFSQQETVAVCRCGQREETLVLVVLREVGEVPQADADCPQVLQRLGRLQLHVAVVRLRWEGESLASEICEQKNNFTVNLKLGQLLGNYKQS